MTQRLALQTRNTLRYHTEMTEDFKFCSTSQFVYTLVANIYLKLHLRKTFPATLLYMTVHNCTLNDFFEYDVISDGVITNNVKKILMAKLNAVESTKKNYLNKIQSSSRCQKV